jgi:multiple sugar transport system permease protein/sn-glycerol 3-phosphate transport system permease protein
MATIEAHSVPRAAAISARVRRRLPLGGVLLAILAVAVLYPLWEIVRVSVMDPLEARTSGASAWPPTFRAYGEAWGGVSFPRYFLNSLLVTLAVTLGSTVSAVMAAYAFARATFPGRDLLFLACVGTLMIPNHVTLIPNYLTFAAWGMLDTYLCLILPFLASGFSVFFLRQHMMTIPRSLDEAARMDGAGTWTILRTVIVPLSWPAIAVVALFAFMSSWNEFVWPLLATTSEDMRTVQIGLRYLLRDEESALPDWPLLMAGTVITLAPLLVAYVVAERHLIRGITMGSFR